MQVNPGGRLNIDDIVGRSREIARYWQILTRQSLILSAERRIGKTHIVWKMHTLGCDGFVTFYQDLESVHSLTELVRSVYKAVSDHLPKTGKLKARAHDLWATLLPQRIGALELPKARDNWKDLFRSAIGDILQVTEQTQRVVLIWDEFPLMLYNIKKAEGASGVIHLLDLLRQLRQENGERLRFIFTGSIGLHLVLRSLREEGYANDPVNDIQPESVPPMREDEALELISRLLTNISPPPTAPKAVAQEIFRLVGGFPYYIHHTIDRLCQIDRQLIPEDVQTAVDELIFADNDPADLNYYVERIQTYYSKEEQSVALATLDIIAKQNTPLTIEEFASSLQAKAPGTTSEQISAACRLLREDHHLVLHRKDGQALYEFRWPVVKKWWKETRL